MAYVDKFGLRMSPFIMGNPQAFYYLGGRRVRIADADLDPDSSCGKRLGNFYVDMVQIDGGMDRLPHAFLPTLEGRIRFNTRMIAIDQAPDSVTIHVQTPAGRVSVSGDYAILTVPFSMMRHIEVLKPFSRPKQRAIRQLHYDASAKIFFQCSAASGRTIVRGWRVEDGARRRVCGRPHEIHTAVTSG